MAQKESNLWHLENLDLFSILCPHKTKHLDQKHELQSYDKDDYIYFSNDPSNQIYMVAEGRVKIASYSDDGKEIIKAIVGAGEIFGEMALFGEGKRTDYAQVLDKGTKLCTMSIDDMEDLMKDNKELSISINKLIGFRLMRAERKIESLVFKDARTRLIDYIKEMAQEKGKKIGDEILVKHNLTHQDIANLTATSRQTVTTILNELKEANKIHLERNRILIRDINSLA